MTGNLNQKESPKITILLQGNFGKPQPFDAIIDTGFTGNISMPLIKALPLGLILFSTASFILADGSKEDTLLCLGIAKIDEIKKPAIISLSKGKDILLGTEFLTSFGVELKLNYKTKTFDFIIDKSSLPNRRLEFKKTDDS